VAAAALAVLAGAYLGTAALFLTVPAAIAATIVANRVEARQAGLMHLAHLDPLTGLGNRRLLRQRLGYEIARHRRHGRQLAVMVMDLNGFKQVNDRFGHPAGDELLREVGRQLGRAVREEDTIVRAGGDEFIVLAPETGYRDAEALALRLQEAVQRAAGGLEDMAASIGYAIFPDEGATPELLLARADAAELEVKRQSREVVAPLRSVA
jgi:diguanylate cyclase (GGDEF)-like protein